MDDLLDPCRFTFNPTKSNVEAASNNPELDQKAIVAVNPFEKDTIASLSTAKTEVSKTASVRESLSSAVSWLWSLVYTQAPNTEQPNGRPILEAPTIQDEKARQSFSKQIFEMQKQIANLDDEYQELLKDNPKNQEALLAKLLTMAIKNQLKIKEEGGLLSTSQVNFHQKHVQSLNKDQKQIKAELERTDYHASLANTIDKAVGVTAGALMLATLAATAVIGVSAPFIPGVSAAVAMQGVLSGQATFLAVAKSSSILLQGYTKGLSDEKTKDSYLVKAQQDLAKDGIKIGFDEMKKALDDVSSMWSLLRETAERQKQASSAMLR